jgi:lactate dehydrogenase-like 2-hydroxyacid dehydrogenase
MKFNSIAVLSNTNLPDEIQTRIAAMSEEAVNFSRGDIATEDQLVAVTGKAEAILVSWRTAITRSYLERCPQLKYIGVCATSTASIDLEAASQQGITVKNVSGYGDAATAEYIFLALLKLARADGAYHWHNDTAELNAKTLGIIGLGAVGKEVARRALGFNMKVHYFSRTRNTDWEKLGLEYLPLSELISSSDVLTIHVPRDVMILRGNEFDCLKPGTILVQTSIGNIIDEPAFRAWIADPRNFAIMDYSVGDAYYQKYKDLINVVFPKIIAGYTAESKQRLGEKVLSNIADYLTTV